MWVKDFSGDLVNLDHVEVISYDGGVTVGAFRNGKIFKIYDGDFREAIINAIRSGSKYMEVNEYA